MTNHEAMEQLFRGILFRFSVCNKLFKRTCFDKTYFPVGRIHEDLSTTYKLFAKANQAIFVNHTGYIYVKREQSILTSIYNNKRLEAFIGWDEIIPFIKKIIHSLKMKCFAAMYFGVLIIFIISLIRLKVEKIEKIILVLSKTTLKNIIKTLLLSIS